MTQETPVNPPETIEKAKLEALVKRFRAKQEWHRQQAAKGGETHMARMDTFKECANELEELL